MQEGTINTDSGTKLIVQFPEHEDNVRASEERVGLEWDRPRSKYTVHIFLSIHHNICFFTKYWLSISYVLVTQRC